MFNKLRDIQCFIFNLNGCISIYVVFEDFGTNQFWHQEDFTMVRIYQCLSFSVVKFYRNQELIFHCYETML